MLLPESLERVYLTVAVYQRDASMLAKDGWQVVSVVHHRQAGLSRSIARWWSQVRHRAAPDIVVRYRRLH